MKYTVNLWVGVIILFCCAIQIHAQYASGVTYPEKGVEVSKDFKDDAYLLSTTISSTDLREHLTTLSSDEYEGRETGYPGIEKAASYIGDYFAKMGLPKVGDNGTYYQEVAFTFSSWEKIEIATPEKIYRQLRDFVAFPQYSASIKDLQVEKIAFGGYGIDDPAYSDYNDAIGSVEVRMVYDGEPVNKEGVSYISGSEEVSEWSGDWRKKSRIAKEKGAKLLLIVSNDLKSIINENRRLMVNSITELGDKRYYEPEGANTLFISTTMAKELLGDQLEEVIKRRDHVMETGEAFETLVHGCSAGVNQIVKKNIVTGKNMLGYVEGNSKKDELVILSAHYDHVGKKGSSVYNGADDNASGTTAVLEILETLVTAKKLGKGPARSVLCLLLTGEEKGLLGSEYYVENPVFALDKTIADVNVDMVGRQDEQYVSSAESYIYVIGSDRLSLDLHRINEDVNQRYSGLILDYKYNDEADPNRFYYRSDHYNFAKKGIPAIFFFNGVHADYHRDTDTIEKINFNMMEDRTRLIFHTVWSLSNRKDRIKLIRELTTN